MTPYHFHTQRGWFSIIQHICSHSIGYAFQGSGERSVNSSHLSPSHRNEPAAATDVKQDIFVTTFPRFVVLELPVLYSFPINKHIIGNVYAKEPF